MIYFLVKTVNFIVTCDVKWELSVQLWNRIECLSRLGYADLAFAQNNTTPLYPFPVPIFIFTIAFF